MTAPAQEPNVCPQCGAKLLFPHSRCWLCTQKTSDARTHNPYASPQPIGEASALQFSLESLFLVMTLVAICLGVFLIAPGFGVLLAVATVPALVRSIVAVSRNKHAGKSVSLGQKVQAFIISLFIMAAVGIASGIAFFVVCFAGAFSASGSTIDDAVRVGVTAGLLIAIPVAGYLVWLTRPRAETGGK